MKLDNASGANLTDTRHFSDNLFKSMVNAAELSFVHKQL